MVFLVEISISHESAALAESMKKMREWLDRRRIEPAVFRFNTTRRAVVFRIEFAGEDQAVAFAEAFGGHLAVGQTSLDHEAAPPGDERTRDHRRGR